MILYASFILFLIKCKKENKCFFFEKFLFLFKKTSQNEEIDCFGQPLVFLTLRYNGQNVLLRTSLDPLTAPNIAPSIQL